MDLFFSLHRFAFVFFRGQSMEKNLFHLLPIGIYEAPTVLNGTEELLIFSYFTRWIRLHSYLISCFPWCMMRSPSIASFMNKINAKALNIFICIRSMFVFQLLSSCLFDSSLSTWHFPLSLTWCFHFSAILLSYLCSDIHMKGIDNRKFIFAI